MTGQSYTPPTRASAAPTSVHSTGPAPQAEAGETETAAELSATASVPEELLLLGLIEAENDGRDRLEDFDSDNIEWLRDALAAVLPAHEAMVRAKVAEEIDTYADGTPNQLGHPVRWITAVTNRVANHVRGGGE